MTETSGRYFGLIVAYLLPGFIALAGFVPLFPAIGEWLLPAIPGGVGPPIYALMAATTIGLIVSCFRWLTIDQLHYWMGVKRPAWDDKRLDSVLSGFDYLVQNHFRYYEFCGNTLVALLWAYGVNRFMGVFPFLGTGTDLGMLILSVVLFTASRDALAKYYTRTGRLLGQLAEKDVTGETMFNGNNHEREGELAARQGPKPKPVVKPNTNKNANQTKVERPKK